MHLSEHLRLFRASVLVAGAFMLLVHAASAHSVTPSVVVDSYERAWGLQDVDGALALLADDAVLTFQDPRVRSLTRRQQIRDFLEGATLQSAPALTTPRQVDANTVTWSERLDGHVLNTTEVTVQAVVEDGKIQSLVYRTGSLVHDPAGPASAATPEWAGAVLAAVALLGLGLLSLASVRSHVRAGSNLRGRLMADLQVWSATPRIPLRAPALGQVSQREIFTAPH
jgi:ketosteroid isomerase-like protein